MRNHVRERLAMSKLAIETTVEAFRIEARNYPHVDYAMVRVRLRQLVDDRFALYTDGFAQYPNKAEFFAGRDIAMQNGIIARAGRYWFRSQIYQEKK